jgi:hypothetical protein
MEILSVARDVDFWQAISTGSYAVMEPSELEGSPSFKKDDEAWNKINILCQREKAVPTTSCIQVVHGFRPNQQAVV